jgi:hypothetical protein
VNVSPNVIQLIKHWSTKCAGLVAYKEEYAHKILSRNPEVNTPLGSPWRRLLKWILTI